MAQRSKKERKLSLRARELSVRERELKLQAAEMYKEFQRLQYQLRQTTITLLAVLGQKGGEVEITKGTIQQVEEGLQTMGFGINPKEGDEQTFVVRLLEGNDPSSSQEGSVSAYVDSGQVSEVEQSDAA